MCVRSHCLRGSSRLRVIPWASALAVITAEWLAEVVSGVGNIANNSGGGGGAGGGNGGGYSRHQLQGNKQHGSSRTGFLLKKSEGKVRKVWQKRLCEVRSDGFLSICHADETKPPTRVNLLTCQIKPVPSGEDRRCFDLISCKFSLSFLFDSSSYPISVALHIYMHVW